MLPSHRRLAAALVFALFAALLAVSGAATNAAPVAAGDKSTIYVVGGGNSWECCHSIGGFNLTIYPVSSQQITFDFEMVEGTATVGVDYVTESGTVTVPPNTSFLQVSAGAILDDDIAEPDETFIFRFSNPSSNAVLWAAGEVTYVIVDDDPRTIPTTTTAAPSPPASPPITTPPATIPRAVGGGGGGGQGTNQLAAAPLIGVLLQDVVLVLGEPPVLVGLRGSVAGTIDAHRAVVADPRIVTAVVSGSKLALNPVALGTTTVSVRAANSRGSVFQSFRVTVIERDAPRFVSLLPDRLLTVGDPPSIIDVAPAFEGTVGSYRATVGDPRVASSVVTGSDLALAGLAPGVTTVTVTAKNVNGVAVQTFRVTVRSRQAAGATVPPGPAQEMPTH